jgi:polysaccharide chain length determinant protein (PEP-CTERM system associated)
MKPNVQSKGYSPLALLRALKRRKLFLLVPALVLTPAIALYVYRMPQVFRARALVGVTSAIAGRPAFTNPDAFVALNTQDQLRVIRETLLSTPVVAGVIREFHLYDLPPDHAPAPMIEAMKARIEIQVEGPEAFYVGFEGPNPEQTMRVANRLAGLFLDRKSDLRDKMVEQEDTFLDAEVSRLGKQLAAEEDRLKVYKTGAAQVLPERVTANLKQLELLQQQIQSKTDQITEGEARRSALNEEVKALANQGVLEPEPAVKTAAEITLEQLRLKLNELKTKYTPDHPEIQRTQKQIQDLEAAAPRVPSPRRQPSAAQVRYVELQAELKSIDPRIESYRRERENLTAEMHGYERKIDASPGLETGLAIHTRDASLTRARYEALLAKQQEAKLSHRAEKTDSEFAYKILESAQLPVTPYSPHRIRIILAAFVGSLGIGLLTAFLAERSHPSFETAEELEQFTSLPVLSSVPAISESGRPSGFNGRPLGFKEKSGAPNGKVAASICDDLTREQRRHFQQHRLAPVIEPQSVASQQYSILALKVQQWMAQTGGKTLLVTSGSGAEGKSLTALNLSLALASSLESRVLLVDGDLRLPRVHEQLGLKAARGFSDLLAPDGGDPDAYISKIGALHVLPGGSNASNPVSLLASRRSREILARLRKDFDLVVIDSPPIVPIADSHILAGLCDGVVLVVRARTTRPELLLRAIENLGATNVIGVVLNDVELAATPYAYAYRYYQKHYLGRS